MGMCWNTVDFQCWENIGNFFWLMFQRQRSVKTLALKRILDLCQVSCLKCWHQKPLLVMKTVVQNTCKSTAFIFCVKCAQFQCQRGEMTTRHHNFYFVKLVEKTPVPQKAMFVMRFKPKVEYHWIYRVTYFVIFVLHDKWYWKMWFG